MSVIDAQKHSIIPSLTNAQALLHAAASARASGSALCAQRFTSALSRPSYQFPAALSMSASDFSVAVADRRARIVASFSPAHRRSKPLMKSLAVDAIANGTLALVAGCAPAAVRKLRSLADSLASRPYYPVDAGTAQGHAV